MRICVIFNPAARGDKARKLRRHLDDLAEHAVLKPTAAPGHARVLAAQAVAEGFETIVAAGGDGTLNEVVNGMGDAGGGFEKARLGLLPLGTINVFAREIGLPRAFAKAWEVVREGEETIIDLPFAECQVGGAITKRYFVQLAGAGLDSDAVERVSWKLKKRLGQWSYVVAGLSALRAPAKKINITIDGVAADCEQALFGNGKFYGGHFAVFPRADLRDGVLDICLLPRIRLASLALYGASLLTTKLFAPRDMVWRTGRCIELRSSSRVALQLDGEHAGELPARIGVEEARLRVVIKRAG